jgi:flagellar biosynthesis/type III secretory pathway protein FliH
MSTEQIKDLAYYRENAEEDYITTPISVLRYIGLLEAALGDQREAAIREEKEAYHAGYDKGYAEGYEFGVTEMEEEL